MWPCQESSGKEKQTTRKGRTGPCRSDRSSACRPVCQAGPTLQGERYPRVTVGDRGHLSPRADAPNASTERISPSVPTPGLGVPHAPCKSVTSQGRGVRVFSKFQDPRKGSAGHARTTGTSTWRPRQGGHQHPPPARQPRQRPQLPTKGGFGADNSLLPQGHPSQASASSCQQQLAATPRRSPP